MLYLLFIRRMITFEQESIHAPFFYKVRLFLKQNLIFDFYTEAEFCFILRFG